MTRILLRPGRERSVLNRHPWVFSGSVLGIQGPEESCACEFADAGGVAMGTGFFNPHADLCGRIYSWDPQQPFGLELILRRLDSAVRYRDERIRAGAGGAGTDGFRLVFSEADGLSGLIVDRYADVLSVRFSAEALLPWAKAILDRLLALTGAARLHAEFDAEALEREGLTPDQLPRFPEAPGRQTIHEHGAVFEVDPASGQKTGFFLDQRDNRRTVAPLAAGARVLGCYCYTGAFEIHAARAGAAEVLGVDSSGPALEQARRHATLNGVSDRVAFEQADVPAVLRRFRDEGRNFDLIILDPPRFVFNVAQKERGLRAYKDINLLAMKLLRPGGWLATFSCSGLVNMADFRSMIRWAAVDAVRSVRMIGVCGQPFDHAVLATFPESEYLKGLICRVE